MKEETKEIFLKIAVNVARFTLAAVFVFSGFVKANDPFGMAFKLRDYATAFGLEQVPFFSLVIAAGALALLEFSLGVYLLFGMSRVQTARLTTLVMGVMTLLTVYIWTFDPVSDCGCFGDVLVISNGATVLKNIVLLAFAIINLKYYRLHLKLVGHNTQWLVTLFSTVYILGYTVYCVYALPVLDFRPYKIGTDLKAVNNSQSHATFDVKIVYEKDGKRMELNAEDDDPDSTWHYVETKRTRIVAENSLKAANLFITDAETGEDVTEDILYEGGYTFLLVIPNLLHADEGCIDLVNETYEYALDNKYGFYCLTGSESEEEQEYWREHTGAEYPFHLCDDRELKTVVRSAPGLLLLKDGVVIRKWSNYQIPDEYVLCDRLENLEIGTLQQEDKILSVLKSFFFPLLAFVLIDRIGSGFSLYRKWKRKSKKMQLLKMED